MLSQTEYDGMFAELGYEFIRDYCALLSRHNLEGVLQTPWIFDPSVSQDNENIQQHLASIQKLSEKKKRDHVIHAHSQQRQ